jgi:Tol biopolymer transport system component
MRSRLTAFVAFRRPVPPLLLAAGVILAFALPASAGAATPGKIVFTSSRDGHDEIYVMNADGTGQTRLTNTPNTVHNNDPSWSPDGKQIAFVSDRDDPNDSELWIMNADGSSQRQLTFNGVPEFSVDWGPDGATLVLGSGNPNNIVLINADGSNLRPIATAPAGINYYGSHFSTDGQSIVFTSDAPGSNDFLNLIKPDGSQQHAISSIDSYAPDFTADGKRIVFYSEQADADGDNEILSMNIDGSDRRQLTFTPGGPTGNDRAPSPSRDGLNRIAFTSNRNGDAELYLMNADGSGVTQLTNTTPGTNRGPDWQPTAVCQGRLATIVGTSASETLTGGPGADVISGQGGDDTIDGLEGDDIVCGDEGKDTVSGSIGNDLLDGGTGKDKLNGGAGNDKLIGGAGNDKLNGAKGKDKLIGGKGNDKLNGGKSKDNCIGGKGKKDTGKSCEKEKKIP